MALADDLLEQAKHLANREPKRPKQASLKRAVSTVYYALFHLLIDAAILNWRNAHQRAQLARAFDHRSMKDASNRTTKDNFKGADPIVVGHLKVVDSAFFELQQHRIAADYNNARKWSKTEVLTHIDAATAAFQSWTIIRKERLAQDFLLSLLIKDRKD